MSSTLAGARQDRPAGDAAATRWPWEGAPHGVEVLNRPIVVGRQVDEGPVKQEDTGVLRGAKRGGGGDDGVESWLQIHRRAGDHTQDLAGGPLLLKRVAQGALQVFIFR